MKTRPSASKKILETQKTAEHKKRIACDLYDTVKGKVRDCPKISFERYILSAYLQDILHSAQPLPRRDVRIPVPPGARRPA
jgi:hypothetical protein